MNKAIVIFFVLEYIKKNIKHLIMQSSILLKLILYYFFDLIFSFIWFGMILVSGVSKKHLLVILAIAVISFLVLLRPHRITNTHKSTLFCIEYCQGVLEGTRSSITLPRLIFKAWNMSKSHSPLVWLSIHNKKDTGFTESSLTIIDRYCIK